MLNYWKKSEQTGCTSAKRLFDRLAVTALLAFGLAACQPDGPPVLSLDEARKATANFDGQSFTPPPKTIDDITAILDRERPDPEAMAAERAKANQQPPANISKRELTYFYQQRGRAARDIGDFKKYISDMKAAVRNWEKFGGTRRSDPLHLLSVAESLGGNFANAIKFRIRGIVQDSQARRPGRLTLKQASLARLYALAGDLDAADKLLGEAELTFQDVRGSSDFVAAFIPRAKAHILDRRGFYNEAEAPYRKALRHHTQNLEDNPNFFLGNSLLILSMGELAENLLRQGRLAEAEIQARRALTTSLTSSGRYNLKTTASLKVLTRIIAAQGRAAEAEKLAQAQIDIYEKIGAPADSLPLAQARANLAEALVNQGKWAAAAGEFEAVKKGMAAETRTFDRFFAGNINWALALLGAGRSDEARTVAEKAFGRSVKNLGANHYDTAETGGVLAMSLARLGNKKAAMAQFRTALPVLLSRSRHSDDEGTTQASRSLRLRLILEAYIGLLSDIRGSGIEREAKLDAAAEAFRIADVARGQSVQRALDASSARAAAKNPALADLVRREQDTLKQIGALYGLFASVMAAPSDQRDQAATQDLRKRIDTLRGARSTLAKEIEKRFPDYAALMNPKPATITNTQKALRPGEALVATYVGKAKTYMWAVPKSGKITFAAVPLGREAADKQVNRLRRALDPQAATLGDIPAFDVAGSHRLYKTLLAPVEAGWKDAKNLLVVAHGPLGQLPFSVLVTGGDKTGPEKAPLFSNYRSVPFLVRTHAVTVLPSVSALATLRSLPAAAPTRRNFAGFGDPLFSETQIAAARAPAASTAAVSSRGLIQVRGLPVHLRAAPKLDGISSADLAKLPRLPDTADEVRGIALAMNADLTRDVFTGKEANEGRVKSMALSGYKVLAFATHGLVPGDLNGLTQPALALSSPKVTGGKEDGLLTMGEILGLKLDADWVVLSACNTASGNGAGAEAVSGLGRAFFYAGTRALLVSNWPVETTSAKALTTDIFKRQATDASHSRADALRQSMLGLIDKGGLIDAKGKMVFSYAHPIFWAPFSLVGDGGGDKPAI